MNKLRITIHDLFPNQTLEEQKEIEETLDHYLDLVEDIYHHLKSEPELYERFRALTAQRPARTIDNGRSFTSEYRDTHV